MQLFCTMVLAFNLFVADGPRLLVVDGVGSDKGKVLVAVFNKSAGFPSESSKAVLLKEVRATKVEWKYPLITCRRVRMPLPAFMMPTAMVSLIPTCLAYLKSAMVSAIMPGPALGHPLLPKRP